MKTLKNNEQEILTLTDREKCRLRTPVFMGSFDCRMINLNEVLMNARDEVNTNFESGEIHINLGEDMKTITIRDTGRGIPIRGVDANGTKKSDLIFKTLFSGCNFQNINKTEGDTFIENCGQNGAGLTTTQYISTFFQGTQILNHEAYEVTYRNGGLEEEDKTYKSEFERGTTITYSLDPTVVTNIYYTYEEVLETIRRVASTTKNKIKYTFTHKDQVNVFNYETFEDYFEENFTSISPILHFNEKSSMFESTRDGQKFKEGNRLEVLLSLSTAPTQETYLNGGFLPEQGTFYKGIIDGLKKFFQKDIKGKTKLTDNDIIMSFNIYAVMGSNNPVYSNQTKKASSNEIYKRIASNYIVENMEIVKIEQPKVYDQILKHLTMINSFNTKNEESIKNIKKKLTEKSTNGLSKKIEGLKDCDMKHSTLEERIFIVDEGLSANSTIIEAFDNRYMGCMGLRGRFINSLKASVEDVLKNEPALGIIQALGCGIEIPKEEKKKFGDMKVFDETALRYGKIAIICDADSFGKGIALSIITFFKKFMPTLLKQGRIYFVVSPRYEVRNKKKESFYAYDEKERDSIVEKLGKDFLDISIRKGLGEFNKEEFWEYVLSPKAREKTFIKVSYPQENKEIDELFDALMGEDIESRKEFIKQRIVNVNLDELD